MLASHPKLEAALPTFLQWNMRQARKLASSQARRCACSTAAKYAVPVTAVRASTPSREVAMVE